MGNSDLDKALASLVAELSKLGLAERVEALNKTKIALHEVSPFASEPVDCVLWVNSDNVTANDYNPNRCAPPEMKLLELSITADGYTQPIVAHAIGSGFEVVDGFHRNRVGKESPVVRERVKGYLPVVRINADREGHNDRVAATIRHNRARGKHLVSSMADIVSDLVKRNWDDKKIAKELGMDSDEVLRLKQVTGLAELFADREFSEAWEVSSDP
jgi:ParB-like chromosome segregation protein Spo0J